MRYWLSYSPVIISRNKIIQITLKLQYPIPKPPPPLHGNPQAFVTNGCGEFKVCLGGVGDFETEILSLSSGIHMLQLFNMAGFKDKESPFNWLRKIF